ncbi:hypothetical protein OV203_21070 [Nannocystis sp. ILAH1]|uniref:hypothetical protein n=1 Tax=unclassified Nannocystis TaxID=2627009 RepID=UPI00227079D3|nr:MULTISPECIES: hypothetical protein [unclassified Nannocystis]MCY0989643.1 hypothetical protein [Nannocystis sp. ILAH1]MCY1071257.1 hypothetical protein [Nannocystis sp. RBIL2]
MRKRWKPWVLVGAVTWGAGCGDDGNTSAGSSTDVTASDPTGIPGSTTGQPSTTGTSDPDTGATDPVDPPTTGTSTTSTDPTATTVDTTGDPACGGCPDNFICKYETCIPDLGPCVTHDDCPGDSYCDADGVCIPYDVPPAVINDPDCTKPPIPEGVTPTLQCEWTGTAPDDPTAASNRIYTTPSIADLNLDKDPGKLQPSIIVTTFHNASDSRLGTLRVFDGRTCEEQMRLGGVDEPDFTNRPSYAATWAVGDLDGDVPQGGHPELVSYQLDSDDDAEKVRLYAVRIDSTVDPPVLERMWYGRDCDNDDMALYFSSGSTLASPLLIDLDDDDRPEILVGRQVFDAEGCLLTTWLASEATGMEYTADVDLDGQMDLVTARRVAGWDDVTTEWVDKPWFVANPMQLNGFTGVADAGLYSNIPGVDPAQQPEVVVLSSPGDKGQLRVQSLDGAVVWGPIETYKTGPADEPDEGGPVTISDFDGDGQVEFASAGASQYVVYDPDCQASLMGMSPPERPGGTCERTPEQAAKNLPDGVLWAQPSNDESSRTTGSSIFDFDGDGDGEAVYRDECYLRVYDGKSGTVLFSTPASSATGLDYPTIADVDGDFATEIIVPRTPAGGCPPTDPLFPEGGAFKASTGFAIYRDPMDRWANSRPVWNQHVYSVTHVTDDARVPPRSEFKNNWQTPGLNNLRQNSQGDVGALQIADLTVELAEIGELCSFGAGEIELTAEVCNRGTNAVQDGVTVAFLETLTMEQDVSMATVVCEAATTMLLQPGQCEIVQCVANLAGTGNVFVDVDPDDKIADCHPGNNLGADAFKICPG